MIIQTSRRENDQTKKFVVFANFSDFVGGSVYSQESANTFLETKELSN